MNAVTTSGWASSVSSSRTRSAISSINRNARSAEIRTVVWVIRKSPRGPEGIPRSLEIVEHRGAHIGAESRRNELRRHAHRPRDCAVRLLTALPAVGEIDQPGPQQHPDVEVQVAGVDAQPLGELAVRQRALLALAEHLEDTQPQRVTERLQLLRTVDREDVE